MTTDEEVEAFLESDLSDIDFTQFKSARFDVRDSAGGAAKLRPKSVHPMRLSPGTPAPRSGIYRETGPHGGQPGEAVTVVHGKPLPPAPKGRRWTLIGPAGESGQK